MLVRASVNIAGLAAGQTADLNGNDPAVRAALNAGFLEKVEGESKAAPVFDDSPMTESERDEVEDD